MNHHILFKKLNAIGITGPALTLIKSYLFDRKQTVCISGTYSEFKLTNIGVPQGSLLGPLLFLIFINDLPQCLKFSTGVLYADDTTIFTTDTNLESLIVKLSADSNNLTTWCRENMLTINSSKSRFIVFRSHHKIIPENCSICLNGNQLLCSDYGTFLGVELDKHLKFQKHISLLTRKVAFGIRILIKVRPYFGLKTLISLYYAFIHSHISYCISSWGNTYPTHLSPLQHIQNQAIRIITHSHFCCSSLPLLREHNILSVSNLVKYSLCIIAFKFFCGRLPIEIITANQLPLQSCTRFALHNNFLLPKAQTNYGKQAVHFSAAYEWNCLPDLTKSASNIYSFKNSLRAHLQSI